MTSEFKPSATSSSFSMDDFAKALDQQDFQFRKGQVVRGKVFQYESDGAYVDIGGKSAAFIPLTEVGLHSVTDLSTVLPLQEEREFLIIREQNADGQVTLSRRQLQIKQLWEQLGEMQEDGKSLEVRVSGVNKGGVIVDVHGLRGFIPRSHLLERENLENLVGQNLTASLLEINSSSNKLVLSQRLATRSQAITQFELGQLVTGKITAIKPFGVFVDLNNINGLLHIKQISQNYIESLPLLFQVGQEIHAIVVDVDETQSRISLSTKVLENYPGEMLEKRDEVMASVEARANRARKKLLE
ncbi:S1 RNA-binding domain-containing protein [Gloeocapsopsis crepidinum LEGE 06123]|uniref:S1 RNA-binding domain-containing protein n=1 Tax=Gloeocapsopsis crepidinum LEGE 06123 TaxID=588587 RepID=A0ABR9UUY2_9CHRO|nr:S1 RNA-binding domain-containing protein [Gloeocapsopsis crepidinum]MBE9192079.1 S1 RNA-binding domain-containing protein [Gloeocapsopsis crepidinum LEGE 06123]